MSLDFLHFVLAMPPHELMRYWGSPKPWHLHGRRVHLPDAPVVEIKDVTLDDSGNITRQTKLVLRPCFGSPTAFLMHGGKDFQYGKDGKLWPSRCARCLARPGCEYVAKARLRISPKIRDARDEWEAAGGKDTMLADRRAGIVGPASHRWADLLNTFDRHGPFTSVNDQRIRDYVSKKLEARRTKDAERHQRNRDEQRRKRAMAGEFDQEFIDRVKRETIHRRLMFDRALEARTSLPWLYQSKEDSSVFTSLVWHAKTLLVARGAMANPSSVATELLLRNLMTGVPHNVLRGRVKPALLRIDRLERTVLPGWSHTIWERVSMDELFAPEPMLG